MASPEELLGTLRRMGLATAADLCARLGISQPTLSRLIRDAGPSICRLGRARATRYALTREVGSLGRRVPVRRIDERGEPQVVGTLCILSEPRFWLERDTGTGELFDGLPPFVDDMSPKGYLGRGFAERFPDLNLPASIRDWSTDHQLIAVARRGEDCTGNRIVGDESFTRFLAAEVNEVERETFPQLAEQAALREVGSSAAGEQPKFTAFTGGRHVVVKFTGGDPGPATRRWRDLLRCEELALRIVAEAGHPAAVAAIHDVDGMRFLEVERFDRVGRRGRLGLLSLFAINNAYLGGTHNWATAARQLLAEGRITAEDDRRIRWLEAFGQLIANSDRHLGNVSFFWDGEPRFRLAPAYDMLPMLFAPLGGTVVERPFTPPRPTADTFEVWRDAARWATTYWDRAASLADLSPDFRERARVCRDAVAATTRE